MARKRRKPTLRNSQVYLATLVNPVDHKLYVVSVGEVNRVGLWAPTEEPELVGQGFLDVTHELMRKVQLKTGFTRAHTPSGVTRPGVGLGLLLYMGLSLAAKAVDLMPHPSRVGVMKRAGGVGVFSDPQDRSPSADAFWDKQVERGFAKRRPFVIKRKNDQSNFIDTLKADTVLQSGYVLALSKFFFLRKRFKVAPASVLASVDTSDTVDQNVLNQLASVTHHPLDRAEAARGEQTLTQELVWRNGQADEAWGKYWGGLANPDW